MKILDKISTNSTFSLFGYHVPELFSVMDILFRKKSVLARDYNVPLHPSCLCAFLSSGTERGIGRGSQGKMVLVKYVV